MRASFYRKLFLAFVAAVFVPVVALALVTRNYVAAQMEASIEQEAIRTASAAGRVVEDLAAPRAAQLGLGVDDNLMVWVSRLIDQDVNMFVGARLRATSERNLFASGLLPTRADADVYRALALRNEAASVTRERIGDFEYLVAATPLAVRQLGILTVPLTSRQREIDEQIDTLDRRALLAALLFILARRRPRLFDGGADLRSREPPDPRHAAHRARRSRRPHRRHLVRRTATTRRGVQQHGRRPAASARRARTHAIASRPGPRWRARWRTRSRTRSRRFSSTPNICGASTPIAASRSALCCRNAWRRSSRR